MSILVSTVGSQTVIISMDRGVAEFLAEVLEGDLNDENINEMRKQLTTRLEETAT